VKFYLAAAWSRRQEMLVVAEKLRSLGVEITSNWLNEETQDQSKVTKKFLRSRAYLDLRDVDEADALVRFTDYECQGTVIFSPALLSCARMVEFGYAKAKGKTLYVVGGYQNIFDRLDGIVHVQDVNELYKILAQEE
jgi:hypothetical protein